MYYMIARPCAKYWENGVKRTDKIFASTEFTFYWAGETIDKSANKQTMSDLSKYFEGAKVRIDLQGAMKWGV